MTFIRKSIKPVNTFNGNLKYHNNNGICILKNNFNDTYDEEDIDCLDMTNAVSSLQIENENLQIENEKLKSMGKIMLQKFNQLKNKNNNRIVENQSKIIYDLKQQIDDWKMKYNDLFMENKKIKKIAKANLFKKRHHWELSGEEHILESEMILNKVYKRIANHLPNNIKNNILSFLGDDCIYDTNSELINSYTKQITFGNNLLRTMKCIVELPHKLVPSGAIIKHLRDEVFGGRYGYSGLNGLFTRKKEKEDNYGAIDDNPESIYWRKVRNIRYKKDGYSHLYLTYNQLNCDFDADYNNFYKPKLSWEIDEFGEEGKKVEDFWNDNGGRISIRDSRKPENYPEDRNEYVDDNLVDTHMALY